MGVSSWRFTAEELKVYRNIQSFLETPNLVFNMLNDTPKKNEPIEEKKH